MMKSVRSRLTLAVAVLAAMSIAPMSAAAAPQPHIDPGATYVALGSSYAAGAGIGTPDPEDPGARCGRTLMTYPNLVAEALDLHLVNATCGGAKIEHIASVPQQVRGGSVPLQVDALTPQTQLVTVTIGGNDANYVGNLVAEACRADLAADPASPLGNGLNQYGLCVPSSDASVAAALAGIEAELVDAVAAIRQRAPHATVYLVDYLTVLPRNGKSCETAPIANDRQKHMLAVADQLSRATKHAAQEAGVSFLAASKLSRAHDVCSDEPWMIGYDVTRGVSLMHPNELGHRAVADALIDQLS